MQSSNKRRWKRRADLALQNSEVDAGASIELRCRNVRFSLKQPFEAQ